VDVLPSVVPRPDGSAFRGQDAPTPDRTLAAVGAPQAPVFAVADADSVVAFSPDPIVAFRQDVAYFTR
jgi:hypothetical protein